MGFLCRGAGQLSGLIVAGKSGVGSLFGSCATISFSALAEAALDKCQRQKVLRGYSQPYKAEQERELSRACQETS